MIKKTLTIEETKRAIIANLSYEGSKIENGLNSFDKIKKGLDAAKIEFVYLKTSKYRSS